MPGMRQANPMIADHVFGPIHDPEHHAKKHGHDREQRRREKHGHGDCQQHCQLRREQHGPRAHLLLMPSLRRSAARLEQHGPHGRRLHSHGRRQQAVVVLWPALVVVVPPWPALAVVVRPWPALAVVVRPWPALAVALWPALVAALAAALWPALVDALVVVVAGTGGRTGTVAHSGGQLETRCGLLLAGNCRGRAWSCGTGARWWYNLGRHILCGIIGAGALGSTVVSSAESSAAPSGGLSSAVSSAVSSAAPAPSGGIFSAVPSAVSSAAVLWCPLERLRERSRPGAGMAASCSRDKRSQTDTRAK